MDHLSPFDIDKALVDALAGNDFFVEAFLVTKLLYQLYGDKVLDKDCFRISLYFIETLRVYKLLTELDHEAWHTYQSAVEDIESQILDDESKVVLQHPNASFVNPISPPLDRAFPWRRVLNKPDCRGWIRKFKKSTWLQMRVDVKIPSHVNRVLSVASESRLHSKWIPYFRFPVRLGLRETQNISRRGIFEKIDVMGIDLPWPMQNRDACLHYIAVDDLEERGKIVILMRSLHPNHPSPLNPPVPPISPGCRRAMVEGAVTLTAVGEETIVEVIMAMDLEERIPDPLLNFFTGTFIVAACDAFKKLCINDPSKGPTPKKYSDAYGHPLVVDYMETRSSY